LATGIAPITFFEMIVLLTRTATVRVDGGYNVEVESTGLANWLPPLAFAFLPPLPGRPDPVLDGRRSSNIRTWKWEKCPITPKLSGFDNILFAAQING